MPGLPATGREGGSPVPPAALAHQVLPRSHHRTAGATQRGRRAGRRARRLLRGPTRLRGTPSPPPHRWEDLGRWAARLLGGLRRLGPWHRRSTRAAVRRATGPGSRSAGWRSATAGVDADDSKQGWRLDVADDHAFAGIEGVVAKHTGHAYRPARRTWQKIRTRITSEAIVGGVIGPIEAPEVLLLGRIDERGRLRVAGRTSNIPRGMRADVGAVLEAPTRIHPWPTTISSSRFGQLPPKPVEYNPVHPAVVVEVDADVAFEHGRWRHPTALRRLRLDLAAEDLPYLPQASTSE